MDNNSYLPDSILTLTEVSQALRLDQRIVSRIASQLGGKRVGRYWRFRWGTVMEYFSDANIEERSGKRLAGQSDNKRRNSGQQVFSGGSEKRAGMDGRETMGDSKEKRNSGKNQPEYPDAYGLRAALGLGGEVSRAC